MQILLITQLSEWERWRSSWQRLTVVNPMASMEWLQAWWQNFGRDKQLHIVAVEHESRLVGILPCYRSNSAIASQLRFLGSGAVCSDFLTAVTEDQHREAALLAINQHLFQSQECSALESFQFDGVADNDDWLRHLQHYAALAGFSVRKQCVANAWNLALPTTWNELLVAYRGHSVYRKAQKCLASLDSGELVCRELSHVSDVDEGMYHLVRLHQARRESLGDAGCFADPKFEPFLRAAVVGLMAERKARFTICESGKQPIGINLQLLGRNQVFMYQSGFDPNYRSLEPGHVALVSSLRSAISSGFSGFDFLRGDEPYKAYWGAQPRMLQRITLAPPTLKAQAIEVVYRNLSWLRSCYNDLSGVG
jgi:CelD/BcsL family acetyltransferase involved in cellulose biosynthesis